MKKTSIILTLAAMLVAMVSCTKEEQPVSGKFTMTVNADKGTCATKGLSLDGTTLNAVWEEGDHVTVNKGNVCLGHLYATTAGSSTILSGTIECEIAVNDVLTLEFLSEYYDTQEGTLEFIASHSDYAKAEVRITSISGGSVTTTDAVFDNQQAIVKFTLKNSDGTAARNATRLVVSVNGTDYTVDPDEETNVFYVALPGFENQEVTLTATVADNECIKTVSNVTFTNGEYYTINVQMPAVTVTWDGNTLNGITLEEDGEYYNNGGIAATVGGNSYWVNGSVYLDHGEVVFYSSIGNITSIEMTGFSISGGDLADGWTNNGSTWTWSGSEPYVVLAYNEGFWDENLEEDVWNTIDISSNEESQIVFTVE